jgi:nitrite reductase/ring-hydroxylating ferredoxin subunit
VIKKLALGIIMLALIIIVVACTGQASAPVTAPEPATTPAPATEPDITPASQPVPEPEPISKPSGPIKATWVDTQNANGTASIPLNEIEENWNIHFKYETQTETMNFMAYILDKKVYVRANVCPPCRSVGFSLDNDILVCDRCATLFEAKTGDGIKGACVNYPKASVPYKITDGKLIMNEDDLITAYKETINRG